MQLGVFIAIGNNGWLVSTNPPPRQYVEVMQALWRDGRSDRKGRFFQMDDCRLAPQPAGKIPTKAGADLEALAYRDEQARDDPNGDPYAGPSRRLQYGGDTRPTNQGVLCASYAKVARMLDELATVPRVRGVMLTFDDFVIGMEQVGTRILPLMRSRNPVQAAA